MVSAIKINKETPIYLSIEEVRALLASIIDARDKLMIRLLYETGCTPTELTKISVSDIAGNSIKIKNEDTKQLRFSKISGKLSKDLSLFIQGNKLGKKDFILSTRQSKKISEKRVRQLVQIYTKKCNNRAINPMMFRYYHIAHAYLNGVFIEEIAKQIGLTKLRIFQILQEFDIKPKENNYNHFLSRIG